MTSDGERDNSNLRKIILWRKKAEFRVIVYCPIPKNDNSESAFFTGLLKSLLALWVLEETRQTWPMFSELRAVVDSERFLVIVFQYRAKIDNSEFGIFTSKHDSMCHKKFRAIVFMYRAKNDNSEPEIHLRTNSEISEFSENSELSLWLTILIEYWLPDDQCYPYMC